MKSIKARSHTGYSRPIEKKGDFLCQTAIKKETGTGMAGRICRGQMGSTIGDSSRARIIAVTPHPLFQSPTHSIRKLSLGRLSIHQSSHPSINPSSAFMLSVAQPSQSPIHQPYRFSIYRPLSSLYSLLYPLYNKHPRAVTHYLTQAPEHGQSDPVKPSRVSYINFIPSIPRDIRAIKALTHILTAS